MYNRIYDHVTTNSLLYEKAVWISKNNLPLNTLFLQLSIEILKSFEENKYTLGVFIDLSKAFDTVNHDILLTKLKYFGIKNTYIDWFKSYLENRKQFVSYDNNKQSSLLSITCGVPQGFYIRTTSLLIICQ